MDVHIYRESAGLRFYARGAGNGDGAVDEQIPSVKPPVFALAVSPVRRDVLVPQFRLPPGDVGF